MSIIVVLYLFYVILVCIKLKKLCSDIFFIMKTKWGFATYLIIHEWGFATYFALHERGFAL